MKLLADENIARDVVHILRKHGYDVFDIKQAGLHGASDARVQSFAASTRRIILTHDQTFLTPEKQPTHRIVVLVIRPGNQDPSMTAMQIMSVLTGVSIPRSRDHAVRILIERGIVHIQKISMYIRVGVWAARPAPPVAFLLCFLS